MKTFYTFILFIGHISFVSFLYGQEFPAHLQKNYPSQYSRFLHARSDTMKINLLTELTEICEISEIDDFVYPILKICENNLSQKSRPSIFFEKKTALAWHNLGFMFQQEGNIPKALNYYEKSLQKQILIADFEYRGITYCSMGLIYKNQGNIPKALDYYNKSIAVFKKINDQNNIAITYNNIGRIFLLHGNQKRALEYYFKSLHIHYRSKVYPEIGLVLNNIGSIYETQKQYDRAIYYYQKSLKTYQSIKDSAGIALSFSKIGSIYSVQNKQKEALRLFFQSLEIRERKHDKLGISSCLHMIATIYKNSGKISLALNYAEKGLKVSQELGYPENIVKHSELLTEIYAESKNWAKAYEMTVLNKVMLDSLNNESNRRASLQNEFQYEYEKKVTADSIAYAKQKEITSARLENEKTQRYALYGGLSLLFVFSGFLYNRYRVTIKQKKTIEKQEKETKRQKIIIEMKQQEIVDSIHYASRIQNAMLSGEELMNQCFHENFFIFYQPKDIVSGDFYWMTQTADKFFLITADCTGHGIPGAFMSLLNINFLSENIIEKRIVETDKILNEQRKKIIQALNPKGNENTQDGMDCVLCAFDFKKNILEFSAANNPLWLIRNNEVLLFQPDKMPVGKFRETNDSFTKQIIELKKDDVIYTFTDGFADQFGGQKGKKFKYKPFQDLLLKIHQRPMPEQKHLLQAIFQEWKGELAQIDDVLIIGIKYS